MAKVNKYGPFQVIIDIADPFWMTKKDTTEWAVKMYRELDERKRQIEALLDAAKIEYAAIDTSNNPRPVCSFCDNDWETEEDGTPCCCLKACDEYDKAKAEKANDWLNHNHHSQKVAGCHLCEKEKTDGVESGL